MKKIISLLAVAVCCFFLATPAQAQLLKWGVKGGLNLAELDIKGLNAEGLEGNTTSFFIGPMVEATVPLLGLGIDGALLYSQKGENEWKQQGIEVPVNLKYTIGLGSTLGVYLAAGPDFYFNLKDIDWADVKTTQVGINLGAGVKLLRKLQVGITYQIPMGDTFEGMDLVSGVDKAISAKTKTWQVSLAYISLILSYSILFPPMLLFYIFPNASSSILIP